MFCTPDGLVQLVGSPDEPLLEEGVVGAVDVSVGGAVGVVGTGGAAGAGVVGGVLGVVGGGAVVVGGAATGGAVEQGQGSDSQ
jgi:hypothetical protein